MSTDWIRSRVRWLSVGTGALLSIAGCAHDRHPDALVGSWKQTNLDIRAYDLSPAQVKLLQGYAVREIYTFRKTGQGTITPDQQVGPPFPMAWQIQGNRLMIAEQFPARSFHLDPEDTVYPYRLEQGGKRLRLILTRVGREMLLARQ